MDTKKLDKWADLLLDTGKRNNLINFKDTRASTVEVLLPSSDVLFEKVDGTASFEVFDPKIVEEDDDTEESYAPEQLQIGAPEESSEPEQLQIEVSEKADTSGGKAAFLAQYSGKIKRQNQILLYNAATNPLGVWLCPLERRCRLELCFSRAHFACTDSAGTSVSGRTIFYQVGRRRHHC